MVRILHTAVVTAVVGAVLLLAAPVASADQTFHTTRYALTSAPGSTVTGTVIDIHAQGPQIYAQERYQLRSAVPGTTYTLSLYLCGGTRTLVAETASVTANRAGNAAGRYTFAPSGLAPGTYFVQWVVTLAGTSVEVASTDCVPVAVD